MARGDAGRRPRLLLCLDALPEPRRCARRTLGLGAEHMRVAADHLARDGIGHVGKCEGALLLGHARVIDDLQQKVAQLVLEARHVLPLDGVGNLIGLLDGVGRNRPEILREIPRTARARRAQRGHDRKKVCNRLASVAAHSGRSKTRAQDRRI